MRGTSSSRPRRRPARRSADLPAGPSRRPVAGLLVACLFLSGATALVYEVVWLRMLGLVFGHTVYAITTVLAAFMAGLGLGGFFFGRRAARVAGPIRTHGVLAIGVGISCALIPAFIGRASRRPAGPPLPSISCSPLPSASPGPAPSRSGDGV